MNYSDLTDEEINRLVAEVIEPEPSNDTDADGTSVGGGYYGGGYGPRDFCDDPAAWGWLLERERISAIFNDLTLPPRWDGAAPTPGGERPYIGMAEKPGRAVAIAFLESKEVR